MAIMKDVAKLAGVSVSTVSFVLNGTAQEHKVSPKTAQKVLQAARDLGYQLNASGVMKSNPLTIAIFIPTSYVMLNMDVLTSGVNKHMKKCGIQYNILMCLYDDNSLANRIRQMSPSIYDAAVVVTGTDTDLAELDQLPANLPLVVFNGISDRYSSVTCETDESIRQVVSIVSAKGYRNIHIISSRSELSNESNTRELFIRQCRSMDIDIPQTNIIYTESTHQGGAIAARQILNLDRKPELVVTMNTTLAYGAIPFLARHEFIFTRDAELLSFGRTEDTSYLKNYIPSLSLIAIPTEEMIMECFSIALQLARTPQHSLFHYVCPSEFIMNESFNIYGIVRNIPK